MISSGNEIKIEYREVSINKAGLNLGHKSERLKCGGRAPENQECFQNHL